MGLTLRYPVDLHLNWLCPGLACVVVYRAVCARDTTIICLDSFIRSIRADKVAVSYFQGMESRLPVRSYRGEQSLPCSIVCC
jgi:hypothetical protein